MMKYVWLYCCMSPAAAAAQPVLPPEPLLPVGVEGYVPGFRDPFSPVRNAAACSDAVSGLALYSERRFMLSDMQTLMLSASRRHQGQAGSGIHLLLCGSAVFQSVQAGISHGRSLGAIHLGASLQYTRVAAAGYGQDGTLHTALAIGWPVQDRLYTALQVSNFLGGRFLKYPYERLARLVEWGIGHRLSDRVALVFFVRKVESRPMAAAGALHYRLADLWRVSGGYDAGNGVGWIGTGWQKKQVLVTVRSGYHPLLGITPGLQLHYLTAPR